MKLYRFPGLFRALSIAALCTLPIFGCGGETEKSSSDSSQKNNQSAANGSGEKSSEQNRNAKPVSVESTLPFKDLDVSTAAKGIDPGRILIDVKGKDSAGKQMALSDYKGKVILLDTWASW